MIDFETKIELMPCPYCGKDAAEFATAQEMEDCTYFEDETKCPAFKPFEGCTCNKIVCNVQRGGCGASTGYAWDKIQAAMKWNKRAQ